MSEMLLEMWKIVKHMADMIGFRLIIEWCYKFDYNGASEDNLGKLFNAIVFLNDTMNTVKLKCVDWKIHHKWLDTTAEVMER
eukprot:2192885-Ditylum_brightwellii.AAC.1